MVNEVLVIIIGLAIIFAFTIFIILKSTKNITGKTTVKIGFETVAVKTYMELDMQNDKALNEIKEKE